jgi:hypothetical protein
VDLLRILLFAFVARSPIDLIFFHNFQTIQLHGPEDDLEIYLLHALKIIDKK